MAPSRGDVGKLVAARLGDRQVNWLAEETGIDRTAIAAIKSGRVGVGLDRGTRLHAALGGKISDYITDARAYERVRREEEPSEDNEAAEAALAAQARVHHSCLLAAALGL